MVGMGEFDQGTREKRFRRTAEELSNLGADVRDTPVLVEDDLTAVEARSRMTSQ